MSDSVVKFKGVQEGLFININSSDIELIRKELDKKINETSKFYQGIKFLGIKSETLTEDEILDLNLILKYKYDFDIELKNIIEEVARPPKIDDHKKENSEIVEKNVKKDHEESSDTSERLLDEFPDRMTKFIHGTLRSGQEIKYEGHIVIIGDVNPGAFIKADGNIVVMGNLRGVAYAGLGGDRNSIIAAYKLLASQLKICDVIGRAPDQKVDHYDAPEVVRLLDGKLTIEPYLPNR